jgi:hypothetical protein
MFFLTVQLCSNARLKYPTTFLGLAKVGFRKYQSSNLVQKLIETTNVQPSTKAPLLPNPCYMPFFFFSFYIVLEYGNVFI